MKRQIDDKGRLEIPRTFLQNLDIKTNDYVDIILVNGVISLRKVQDDNLKKPQQVQGIEVTATSNTITLSWIYNNSNNITFYIYRSESNTFPIVLSQPTYVTSLRKWIDYNVVPSTIYYFKIVAVDIKGNYSQSSITVSAKTHDDSTPLIIKVDREQKKKVAKEDIQKQIIDNEILLKH